MCSMIKRFCFLMVVFMALPVMAAEMKEPAAKTVLPAVTEVKSRAMTVTVVAVDYTTRKISLKGPEGNVVDLEVAAEVKNLATIKAGDQVRIEYVETVAVSVRKSDGSKPSDKVVSEKVKVVRPGAKPMMVQVKVEEIVMAVTAIDAEKRIINLKLPNGGIQTYFVPRKYRHLDSVKKGDQVVVRLSQSICTRLTKVGKAAKTPAKPAPVPAEK